MYSLSMHLSNLNYDTMTCMDFIYLSNMLYKDIRDRRASDQLGQQQAKGVNQVKQSLMKRFNRR